MSGKAVGRTAAALPWLCPNTDSLLRLAEAPATLARPCGADPSTLAFLLRFAQLSAQPQSGLFCPASLSSAGLPEAATVLLTATPHAYAPAHSEVVKRCRALTAVAVPHARRIAEETRRACAERAAALAALAPLGWLAVAAIDHGAAAEPLHDPDSLPHAAQAEVWEFDQNTIARRLATRWRLPGWVATALGNFGLPLPVARPLLADPDLFAVVQIALIETETRSRGLGLTHGADRAELLRVLRLDPAVLDRLWVEAPAAEEPPHALEQNPHHVPLLPNLLKMAAENRRRNGAALVARLEDRLDDLHRAVARGGSDRDAREREGRLDALAELAAGAGHEINNPLAVISGHAQRLLRTEPDPDRGEALRSVVRQTHRIAGIVRDLMQFARPPRPRPHRIDATALLAAVREELAPFAAERVVRVEFPSVTDGVFLRCDFAQVKHALAALVRNGIEAAGTDGWVRVSCSDHDDEFVQFAVEDSGPGLDAEARDHCFDPFYSGRSAGRGRGLGLPTAWQFARRNGGEVRHEPTDAGPTRFVFTVPRSISLEFLDRQSA